MLVHFDKPASASEIKEALEGNDPVAKVQALQKAIMMLLNGEQIPALFITIIRYVLPSEDHTIQKLLLLYLVSKLPAIACLQWCCFNSAMTEITILHSGCRRPLRRPMPMASFCQRW